MLGDVDFVFLITVKDGACMTTIKQRALADSVLIATNGVKYKKKNSEPLQVTDSTMQHHGKQLPSEITNHAKNALTKVILRKLHKEYTHLLITFVRSV